MTLSSLPTDASVRILTAPPINAQTLCSMRLVCRNFKEVIDDESPQNPIWKVLSLREGLREMTTEERDSQTYQKFYQRNWIFIQLTIPGKIPTKDCGTWNHRFISILQRALRLGHQTLVCQLLGERNSPRFHLPGSGGLDDCIFDVAAGAGCQAVVSFSVKHVEDWRAQKARKSAASNGQLQVVEQLFVFDQRNWGPVLPIAAGKGHIDIVRFLLENSNDLDSKEEAYLIAVVTDQQEIAGLLHNFIREEMRAPSVQDNMKREFQENFESFLDYHGNIPQMLEIICNTDPFRTLSDEDLTILIEKHINWPSLIEVLLTHKILGPRILSNEGCIGMIIGSIKKSPLMSYKAETMIQLLHGMHRASQLRLIQQTTFDTFFKIIFLRAIGSCDDELVEFVLSSKMVDIPEDIAKLIVKHINNPYPVVSSDILLKACQSRDETQWLFNLLKELT